MSLTSLSVTGVRNLHPVTLSLSPRVNLFSGANGSGKTSLLEAVYLLGMARSFRSTRLQPVIQHDQQQCTVFGQVDLGQGIRRNLGISRDRQGEVAIRIDGQTVRSTAQLAETLPIQLINPDSFRLLEGSPKIRRQFLDWGVFHGEPRFLSAWQRMHKALQQRNSWLRHGKLDAALQAVWDRELVLASDEIDAYRQCYIQRLKPVFERVLQELIALDELTLSYYRGWDKERSLTDVLQASSWRDQQLGYTQAGPQRADVRLRLAGHNAAEILSRGQQKLVVCALRIAQGHLIDRSKRGQCVYLIDDLPSELDEQHRRALCRLLEALDCQVFVTCIDSQSLQDVWQHTTPLSLFQVVQGQIQQTTTTGGSEA